MIIGISGAQGQGKSTLIKAAIEEDGRIIDAGLQTSRHLLQSWNYSLTEINKYLPLKIRFQENLLFNHTQSLRGLLQHDTPVLVERTFADIFVYALVSIGPFNEYSDWLDDYALQCKDAQEGLFDWTVYLSGRDYIPEEDGVRSTNHHFGNMVDELIKKYTGEFGKGVEINVADLDERVKALIYLTTEER
jgi:hypothetical protein